MGAIRIVSEFRCEKSLCVKVDGEEFDVQDFESLKDGGMYT